MNEPDKTRRNVAASVRARLLNKARADRCRSTSASATP